MAHKHEVNVYNAGQARRIEHRDHYHNPAGQYAIGRGHHHGHTHGWHTPSNAGLNASGSGMSVDPNQLYDAATKIANGYTAVEKMVNNATDHTHASIANGTGPIASNMRKAFATLADDNRGLLGMLNHYRDNMDALQRTLLDTAKQYRDQEESAQQSITSAGQPNQSNGV